MGKGDRYSQADIPQILTDKVEIAEREAANGLRQYDALRSEIISAIERDQTYRLRPSTILGLHKIALDGLDRYAGNWRPGQVRIVKSAHEPPHESRVAALVEEMCDFTNENPRSFSALELSAYVLWRLCWIHPFTDGNGRTARAVSYLVLCATLKTLLAGAKTIPDQIAENKLPYYQALEAIDATVTEEGHFEVTALADLLASLLATQLLSIHSEAEQNNNEDKLLSPSK